MQHFDKNVHLKKQPARSGDTLAKELIARSMRGDRVAQKALYDALAPKMFALCIRYMGSKDEAADVLQDGFVTLFTKLGSYSGEGSFEGWARKIFVNTALMSLRRVDALKLSDDISEARSLAGDSPSQVQEVGYQELLGMISGLPPGFRTVFNMAVIEGYSHKEIAEELGISESTSRSQLLRARTLLQEKIKKQT